MPVIVLESGLGTPSSYKDWQQIQSKLSNHTRVISYDRAGYGWSDSAPNKRTAEQIADDLYALLKNAGEKGPFLLVGHSFGGFSSQVFAHKYKGDTAGLFLIDPSHVNQEGGFSKLESYLIRGLKEAGAGRVMGAMNMLPLHEYFASDPASEHFFHRHFYNNSQMSELEHMMNTSREQVLVSQKEGYADIPLYILSAEHEEYPDWQNLQDQTAALSEQGKHIVVKNAGHYIHLDQPELVVNFILEMAENLHFP
nr:alpha/beta hydrolase [Metabacillus lacus]